MNTVPATLVVLGYQQQGPAWRGFGFCYDSRPAAAAAWQLAARAAAGQSAVTTVEIMTQNDLATVTWEIAVAEGGMRTMASNVNVGRIQPVRESFEREGFCFVLPMFRNAERNLAFYELPEPRWHEPVLRWNGVAIGPAAKTPR